MGQVYRPSLDRQLNGSDELPMPPCTKDPDLFVSPRHQRAAQWICMTCPVKQDCLSKVLALPKDPGGVYGGLTQAKRADLRKRLTCPPPRR
jgi:hypothetical protein